MFRPDVWIAKKSCSALSGSLSALLALALSGEVATAAERTVEYNRDIRPILAENCFSCHGPDSASRKGDLRLDQRDAAVAAQAIVPGKPDTSRLIERIRSTDPDELMPPPSTHKKLTAAQHELLSAWIRSGAEYQPHWSLITPVRAAVPKLKRADWVRQPLDAYVLGRLEAEGLEPAPEADRRTLARRLSLDLRGLPPEPAEVEAFVNDHAEGAYERYVDRLLASPQWGEHRARYWLDAARYGDTHGIHFDNYREIWAYRDWVINAFNRNLPFDQFTVEQLAGDMLPDRNLDQQIATGFNRCNITTNEGGIIDEEYLVLYARDRTETVAQVWLGLTAGCAVCHDHKFDPLSQREFYELAAFFNNLTVGARDGNGKEPPPILVVPRAEDRQRWSTLETELAAANKRVEDRRATAKPEFDRWAGELRPERLLAETPRQGLRLHAPLTDSQGAQTAIAIDGQLLSAGLKKDNAWEAGVAGGKALKITADTVVEVADAGDFERDQAFTVTAWINFAKSNTTGPILSRMDARQAFRGWDLFLEGGKLATHIVHHWDDNATKLVATTALKPDTWYHVALAYDGRGKTPKVELIVDGQAQKTTAVVNKLSGTIRTPAVFSIGQRSGGARLDNLRVQDVRLYDQPLDLPTIARIQQLSRLQGIVNKPAAKRSAPEQTELFTYWLKKYDNPFRELTATVAKLDKEAAEIKARGTVAHVAAERPEPPKAYVLFRGEYDHRRDQVNASTPNMLPPMPSSLQPNRLGFAEWLLRPENPLTARVTVNRFWQELFGTGLVRTSGDFGVAGELPSHQDLLDYLALEFREQNWDIKRFFKMLVTSATYRQAAIVTPAKLERDPQNRLLSRGPRFRMDAEMVRDYALAASGLLVPTIGGPSVKPYQPDGVWEAVAMIGSNTRSYQRDSGPALYRRSMYTFWKRSAPPASMDVLNAPNRETCTVRRERTNTPLQALATLNDVQLVEAARQLAQAALLAVPAASAEKAPAASSARVDFLARRLLARPLNEAELKIVLSSLDDLSKFYVDHRDDAENLLKFGDSPADKSLEPTELATWTMLANELMNLDEVLNK